MFSKTATRNRYMSSTVTYYLSPFIMVIPPGKEFSAFESLLRPFKFYVWLFLLIIIIIAIATIFYITKFQSKFVRNILIGDNNRSPILYLYQIILGVSTPYLPHGNFARYMLMMFLLFCFVIRTMYQGLLFEFLQSNARELEVQSINEMISKKFLFYMVPSALENVKNIPEILER